MTEKSRIVILGGGFGGLYTALRLSELSWPDRPEITLIDRSDRFLFSPLLYELLTGELETWEIAPPFIDLLKNTNISFIQGDIDGINVENREVKLTDGQVLRADRLVLAMGSETPLDLVPTTSDIESQNRVFPFRTVTDAYRLAEKLKELEHNQVDRIRVAIIGGGYSGIEVACKIADRLGEKGRIRIVEMADQILANAPVFNREAAQAACSDKGIWLDLETTVAQITADSISLTYKEQTDTIPVDLVIWTVGNRVNALVKNLPLPQNKRGQIMINARLQVNNYPDIFALGDLAECYDINGEKVPTTAQAALQQADYVAWNVWASLCDRPLLDFRYQALGEMMTLGVNNATLTGFGVKLDGPIALLARRLVYLYRMPTFEQKIKVGLNWLIKPWQELLT